MNALSKKKEARRLEEEGRLPEALTLYREVLAELERDPPSEHLLPGYVKVGELALGLGDTRGAVTAYAGGAELFARRGDAESVAELCLRILRADPTRKDVHARFARRLLDHGHAEEARQLLLDYARRARSDNLHRILSRMDQWSEQELERLLSDFLDRVVPQSHPEEHAPVRRDPPAADTCPAPAPTPPPLPSQPAPPQGKESDTTSMARAALTETKPPPPIPTEARVAPAHAAGPPAMPPLTVPPSEPPQRTSVTPTPAPEPEVPAHAEQRPQSPPIPTRPKSRLSPERVLRPPAGRLAVRRGRRRAPGLVPMGLAAVLLVAAVLGYAIAPPGFLPFGIKDGPAAVDPATAAEPAAAALAPADSQPSATQRTEPEPAALEELPNPDPTVMPADSRIPTDPDPAPPPQTAVLPEEGQPEQRQDPAVVPPTAIPLVAADSMAAISDTAVAAEEPEEVSDTSGPTLPQRLELPERVVIVEGLPVLDVSTFQAPAGQGHRVTQLLESGDTLSLVVVPLDPATASQVEAGRVRVRSSGTSAIGTTRFGLYLVTGRALLSASAMESLLRHLLEIEPQ